VTVQFSSTKLRALMKIQMANKIQLFNDE